MSVVRAGMLRGMVCLPGGGPCGLGTTALLVMLLFLGAALRLQSLSWESAWGDELASFRHLDEPSLGRFIAAEREVDGAMTPLYFVIEYWWAQIFGVDVTTVRLLSVLFSLLTLPVIYFLGVRMGGVGAGLLAVFIAAAHPMHIQYSQEIRTYALSWLLAAAALYSFLGLLEKRRHALVACVVINGLLMMTHVMNVFVIVPQSLFVFALSRRTLAAWALSHTLILVAVAGWIATAPYEERGDAWMPLPNISSIGMMVSWYTGAGGFQVRENVPGLLRLLRPLLQGALVAVYAGAVIHAVLCLLRRRDVSRGASHRDLFVLLAFSLVPPAGLGVFSYAVGPMFVARYVGYVFIPLCVLLAVTVWTARDRRIRAMFMGVVFVLVSAQAWTLVCSRPIRSDWNTAIALLRAAPAPILVNTGTEPHQPLPTAGGFDLHHADGESALLQTLDTFLASESAFWVVLDDIAKTQEGPVEERLHASGITFRRHVLPGRYGPFRLYACGAFPSLH